MDHSFPICFEFIVANEEAASGLSERAGPKGSLDISITFRRGYRGTLHVNPFTVKQVQLIQNEVAQGGKHWPLSG